MSSSAGSELILGVEVKVEVTQVKKPVTRYDPKTGAPMEIELTTLAIGLGVSGAGLTLPDSDASYEERTHNRHDQLRDWIHDEVRWRVAAWFKDRGFKSGDEDITKPGDLIIYRTCGRYFAGKLLGQSSQSGYPTDEFATAVALPKLTAIAEVHKALVTCFGLGVAQPWLLLITTFG